MGLHEDMIAKGLRNFEQEKYARVAAQMQQERAEYLAKVQNGRRVAKVSPDAPRFSEEAEAARQAHAVTQANRRTRR